MKNLILIFTLLSVFFVWSCNDEINYIEEWDSSARVWETKIGYYRGLLEVEVDGLPMDTIIQQIVLEGNDYNRVYLIINNVVINEQSYDILYFEELFFKEDDGVIHIKGEQKINIKALGLVSLNIEGEIKNDVLTFDLTINGLHSLEICLSMKGGCLVEKFPSGNSSIERVTLVEEDKINSPFITGSPTISTNKVVNQIVFYVADSLTITDSTFFSVSPTLYLAPGAWIESNARMNWTIEHSDIEDFPSIARTDSLFHFSKYDNYNVIKVWAADSINSQDYIIIPVKSNAIKLSLSDWENKEGYQEPIAGWTSNNAYIHQLLASNTIHNTEMYVQRVLGSEIGDIGAKMETEVVGTVADSNIRIITGRLFRGQFDLDSIDSPKKGEFHGMPFSKRKPIALRAYYKYLPGEVLYLQDSIVPDSVLTQTDSCYIEAFLYESISSGVYLDNLDYMNDPKVIGYAKFISGKTEDYKPFTMEFTVRNWVSSKRYHLGIVCRSSGKDDKRIGSPGSVLSVSGFELMSTE